MKCLTDCDAIVSTALELWPHPDLIKALESLRAQVVLDVAGERLRLLGAVPEPGEPE
jgi:hypothetical protein